MESLRCYFGLFCLNAVLFCSGLPTTIRTSTLDVDSKLHSVTTDFTDTGDDSLKVLLGEGIHGDRNFTSKVRRNDILKDLDFRNLTANNDSSLASVQFLLSGAVGVSDMNSSGEGTAENLQRENQLQDHSEDFQALLESLHAAIVDADLFITESNETNTADQSEVDSEFHTTVRVHTLNEETGISHIALLNDSSQSEESDGWNSTESENMTLGTEREFQMPLYYSENTPVADNVSDTFLKELHSSNPDFQHSETNNLVNVTDYYTGSTVKETSHDTANSLNGDVDTVYSETATDVFYQSSSGINFTTISLAADYEVETEAIHLGTPVDYNSTVSPATFTTISSMDDADTTLEGSPCPAPSTCLLWFLARHDCHRNSDCSDSRICCRVRCSRTCINL